MIKSWCAFLYRWLPLVVSFTFIILALAADLVGIDADHKWGPFRTAILAIGVAGFILTFGMRAVDALDLRLLNARRRAGGLRTLLGQEKVPGRQIHVPADAKNIPISPSVDASHAPSRPFRGVANPILKRLLNQPVAARLVAAGRRLPLGMLFLAVGLLYVWIVSVGQITWWPETTSRYNMLADSFLERRVDLLIDPSPRLAELENPYSPLERRGIPRIGDASYFEGRYYLYFGPVPAAFVALWKLVSDRAVGDQYVVFAAASLTFLFSALLVLYLKRSHFPSLPGWLVVGSLSVMAAAHPLLWVLSGPAIYEAAISSGQAFLLGGLFFALPAIDGSDKRPWRLAIAGGLWAMALGSRMALAGGVTVLAFATLISIFREGGIWRRSKGAAVGAAALLLPMAFGGGILGLYNYVRFGNLLETGWRYVITPVDLISLAEKGQLFSPAYLAPNLLYYLLAPVRFVSLFPLIKPVRGDWPPFSQFLRRIAVPEVHSVEDITGLIIAVPFILFTAHLVSELVCGRVGKLATDETIRVAGGFLDAPGTRRIAIVLLLATVTASLPTLLFFAIASRYSLDYSPLLILTSVIGSWLLYTQSRPFPIRRSLVNLLIASAIIATLAISFLIAISGPASRFDDFNPVLWEKLIRLLSLQ